MITEDYVSFELAKLLKDKGFDGECRDYYNMDGHLYSEDFKSNWNYEGIGVIPLVSAPTLQMTMKWLRNTYKLYIEVESLKPYELDDKKKRTVPSDKIEFHASIIYLDKWDENLEEFKNTGAGWYSTYEEAIEAALKYCLQNLI